MDGFTIELIIFYSQETYLTAQLKYDSLIVGHIEFKYVLFFVIGY